jgi:phage terminase large subunit
VAEYEFRVRWYQRAFHEALVGQQKRRLIEIAHRRWGKDEIVLNGFRELSQKRVGTYWHCFPEYAQARKAIWNGINGHTGKRRIDEAFPPEIRKRINDNDMFIETVWGSTWQLLGSDRYDATVGSGPVGVAYSEWALCNPAAWAYHKPMIEESNGVAAFITTPRGNNHAKTMYERAKASPYWFAELSGIHATGALTADQLAESLAEYQDLYGKDLGLALFEQEYYCSFNGAMVGAYWGAEINDAERSGRMAPQAIDRDYPVHTAWDLGKAANNPIWCFQVIPFEPGPRIVDFYRPDSDDLEDWCRWLDDRGYHGNDYVPHDAMHLNWGTNRTRFDTLKLMKRKPKLVGMVSVADGINAGRQTIKVAKFHKADDERGERVEIGIEGLKNYRREWDDDLKRFRDNPVKDWAEHIGSSFRYLGLAWKEAKGEATPVPPKKEAIYQAQTDGSLITNMSVKEAVDAMVRKRKKQGRR